VGVLGELNYKPSTGIAERTFICKRYLGEIIFGKLCDTLLGTKLSCLVYIIQITLRKTFSLTVK